MQTLGRGRPPTRDGAAFFVGPLSDKVFAPFLRRSPLRSVSFNPERIDHALFLARNHDARPLHPNRSGIVKFDTHDNFDTLHNLSRVFPAHALTTVRRGEASGSRQSICVAMNALPSPRSLPTQAPRNTTQAAAISALGNPR
jgi:hypothetical protein